MEKLVKRLSRDQNVLGVMLFGSQARGTADKFSDIDVYVLVARPGPYRRQNYLAFGTLRFDIFFDTKAGTEKYLTGDRYSVRRPTSHMLAHGTILFDRQDSLGKIQGIARRNLELKTRYTREEILMHLYSIDDFWGEVQRDCLSGDATSFGMNCQLLIANMAELFLKVRGSFFHPPREMPALMRKLDPRFERMVRGYFTSTSALEKKRALGNLVKLAYTIAGGPMPRHWVLK